jgi:hypothetical protein
MKKTKSLFPGSNSINILLFGLSIILGFCAFIVFNDNSVVSSLLIGLSGSMFIAGFVGYINIQVLSNEVHRVTSQPFEDSRLLSIVRGSGIEDICKNRSLALEKLIFLLEEEDREIVIVGSSLKGLIGVGSSAVGHNKLIRDIFESSLRRNVDINLLMTSPRVADHRSKQEGRIEGDIESEILENLMYLIKIKFASSKHSSHLNIKLYNGTPTIFMIATPNLMMLNPYPYYSTAYGSFSFIIRSDSDLYKTYYMSHYQSAWSDIVLNEQIDNNKNLAKKQIDNFIKGKNSHSRLIIPQRNRQNDLLNKLSQI